MAVRYFVAYRIILVVKDKCHVAAVFPAVYGHFLAKRIVVDYLCDIQKAQVLGSCIYDLCAIILVALHFAYICYALVFLLRHFQLIALLQSLAWIGFCKLFYLIQCSA